MAKKTKTSASGKSKCACMFGLLIDECERAIEALLSASNVRLRHFLQASFGLHVAARDVACADCRVSRRVVVRLDQ